MDIVYQMSLQSQKAETSWQMRDKRQTSVNKERLWMMAIFCPAVFICADNSFWSFWDQCAHPRCSEYTLPLKDLLGGVSSVALAITAHDPSLLMNQLLLMNLSLFMNQSLLYEPITAHDPSLLMNPSLLMIDHCS